MTDAARRRLGAHVRDRRVQLGLTMQEAADAAAMNVKTWTALERGTRATRDSNWAHIERVLRWRSGSVVRILEGRDPLTTEAVESVPEPPPEHTNELPDSVAGWDLRSQVAWVKQQDWPTTDKRQMISYLFQLDRASHGDQRRMAG